MQVMGGKLTTLDGHSQAVANCASPSNAKCSETKNSSSRLCSSLVLVPLTDE
jgi:hypothetical protein